MRVLISGSVAYDRIMDFPGKFSDHILPDKIHSINVSFGLDRLSVRFGGTAGNIAYSLALLGESAAVISQVGTDFIDYQAWLKSHRVDQRWLRHLPKEHSATAHIITDQSDNQITAFYFGAMATPATTAPTLRRQFASKLKSKNTIGILAAGNITDMLYLAKQYRAAKIPYIVDPGQQTIWLTAPQLRTLLRGAHTLIVNDYELALVEKKLKTTLTHLRTQLARVIVTLGEKGATWYYPSTVKSFSIAQPKRVIDPTGAGDAYRAGVILGMVRHWPDELAGQVAALCATYAIEHYGTQEHTFTHQQFKQRFRKTFKLSLPL